MYVFVLFLDILFDALIEWDMHMLLNINCTQFGIKFSPSDFPNQILLLLYIVAL